MTLTTVLGIVGLVALFGFVVFAFRQGEKVKSAPEGVPPEHSGGGVP